ncbi:MAG: redoxin domain-containing protein [Tunicatimonas sp.]|uniref:redoxin domain-containing protein n=1 Tax=Tunicatimonas sp. TaxID=1940096 RepID=UPI003C76FBAB
MRYAAFTLIFLALFFNSSVYAQQSTLTGTVEQSYDEEIYVLLYPGEAYGRNWLGQPLDTVMVADGSFELLVNPGSYVVVLEGAQHDRISFPALLPTGVSEKVALTLAPFHIAQAIDSVALIGEFNGWKQENSIALHRRDSRWVTEETAALDTGGQYQFLINGKQRTYVPTLPTKINGIRGQLHNYYQGDAIEFDSADMPVRSVSSSVSWPDGSINANYQTLRDSLLVIEQERRALIPAIFSGELVGEEAQDKALIYWDRFGSLYEKYASRFPQIVAENRLTDLLYLHPVMIKASQLEQQSAVEKTYDSLFQSAQFDNFMSRIHEITATLDPQSYLMDPYPIPRLARLDQYLSRSMYLRNAYSLNEDHYYQYMVDYADSALDDEKAATILFMLSYEYLREENASDKGISVLEKLKAEYPESEEVKLGAVDKQLTGMRTIAGKAAPEFAVKTLAGDSLRLTDLAGKYVYIDFWGSWCRPCLDEFPNLIALSEAFSTDQLQIVGLAQDREPNLRKYLEEHPLPYPNALAPQVVEAYGITSFPTTFLISPSGVIIAKNLRGENLAELVKNKIESHEATATKTEKSETEQKY